MGLITLATKKLCAIFLLAFASTASFQSAAEEELVPMCERTPEVVKAFEDETGLPCDQILKKGIWIKIINLTIFDASLFGSPIAIKKSDLSGPFMFNRISIIFMNQITLPDSYLDFLPEVTFLYISFSQSVKFEKGSLRTYRSIETLTLDAGRDISLHKGVLLGFPNLREIQSQSNHLDFIEDNAFVELQSIERVNVNLAPLRKTSRAAFTGVPKVIGLLDGFSDPQQGEGTWD